MTDVTLYICYYSLAHYEFMERFITCMVHGSTNLSVEDGLGSLWQHEHLTLHSSEISEFIAIKLSLFDDIREMFIRPPGITLCLRELYATCLKYSI